MFPPSPAPLDLEFLSLAPGKKRSQSAPPKERAKEGIKNEGFELWQVFLYVFATRADFLSSSGRWTTNEDNEKGILNSNEDVGCSNQLWPEKTSAYLQP